MSSINALASAGWHVRQLDQFDDLLGLYQHNPQRYPFLLESVATGTPQSRFDILFAFPGESLELTSNNTNGDFFQQLDEAWSKNKRLLPESVDLPFIGGWFLYLSYEFAQQVESCLQLPDPISSMPVAQAVRIPAAVIRDHLERKLYLLAEEGHGEKMDLMQQDLVAIDQNRLKAKQLELQSINEEPPQNYIDAVQRIKQYVVDGDIFQVNISREWQVALSEDATPLDLYLHLRESNPAPFAALANIGECTIISSSPERLVSQKDGIVETRPIAGTRPRGNEDSSDQAYLDELIGHPKERAEHVMLIDLERNDLGRIAKPGTVEVDELMVLESYAHVHHIVSNVRAEIREEITPSEVIRAVFPGGTITGCPKVRCMEIIAELEQSPRGPYTGSLGYLNCDGSLDLNILIRTMWMENNKVMFRAGAGIVHDSIPEAELHESRVKAKGMLLAVTGGEST